MPRDPENGTLDEAATASNGTAEASHTLLARAAELLRRLPPLGVLIGYGAWSWGAWRVTGLAGTAGNFWHDVMATALITAPVFASMWWSARQQRGAALEALGFWAGLAFLVAVAVSL